MCDTDKFVTILPLLLLNLDMYIESRSYTASCFSAVIWKVDVDNDNVKVLSGDENTNKERNTSHPTAKLSGKMSMKNYKLELRSGLTKTLRL